MSETALEVIVLTAADAAAAERGGADRLEVVSAIEVGGLTPTVEEFARIRAATRLPLRVMLRTNGGYTITSEELATVCDEARALRRAGAEAFVCGFLTHEGTIDRAAMATILEAIAPCPWTFHRAFDHNSNLREAWDTVAALGADLILTSGAPADLPVGLDALGARASWQTPTLNWLAGGGLTIEQIPPLRKAGIAQFHVGRAVRLGMQWDQAIDEGAVRRVGEWASGRSGPVGW